MATKNQKNTSSWTFVKWLLESPCSYVFKNHSSSFYCWRYVLFCCYYHNLNHYHSCHIIQYDFIFNFFTILYFIMYHYCTIFLFIFFLLYLFVYFKFNFVPFFLIVLLFAIFLKLFHASNESIKCFICLLSFLVLPLPALKPSETGTPRPSELSGKLKSLLPACYLRS